jgi:hypothetical protein
MRLRPLIQVLAVFGVLVHAGALVRHNTAMVGATLEYNALLSDVGTICHGNPDSSGSVGAELPRIPPPSNSHDACAICLGLVAAVALLASQTVGIPKAIDVKDATFSVLETTAEMPRALHPPPRGPPLAA